MILLKAIVGGVVGGALGIGTMFLVEAVMGHEAGWLALVVGLFTGLGVRWLAKGSGSIRIACGAIALLLSLAAILAGKYAVVQGVAAKAPMPHITDSQAQEASDDIATEETANGEKEPEKEESALAQKISLPKVRPLQVIRSPGDIDIWQFAWLAGGALIAYELGRGGGHVKSSSDRDDSDAEQA